MVTIVDFVSGRGLGGHFDDYLRALEASFEDVPTQLIAPFHDGEPVPGGRLGMYRLQIAGFRRAFKAGDVAIVHTPEFSEHICCWIAAKTVRKSRRAQCLFTRRRSPDPSTMGIPAKRLGAILIRLTVKMIRKGVIVPVSDSKPALDAWLALVPGATGELVALPPAPGTLDAAASGAIREPAGTLVAVAGRMRSEKGAAHYPAVVDAALAEFPDGGVALQVAEHDDVSRAAIAELRSAHAGDERVQLLDEHLPSSAYSELLRVADIAVLPYEVAAYGAGTSGVIGDAHALGAVVVVSRIEWAVSEFEGDDRVVWLDEPITEQSLRAALKEAKARAGAVAPETDTLAAFAESWRAAVEAARRRSA